jgi:hypothetical protein
MNQSKAPFLLAFGQTRCPSRVPDSEDRALPLTPSDLRHGTGKGLDGFKVGVERSASAKHARPLTGTRVELARESCACG